MKRLLKLGFAVPAALALGVGFSAFAADNSDNNGDLNRDLNDRGAVTRDSQQARGTENDLSATTTLQADNDNAAQDSNTAANDRQIVDRRGRTPGKTSVTNAAGQDRWWWGGWWGHHHSGGGNNGGGGNNDNDEDNDEGPDEGGETQTNP